MADVSTSSVSSLAPRLPMESKEERRKRRDEKRKAKQEHNRRKEERAKERAQREAADASPAKRPRDEEQENETQDDSTIARQEAKRLKKLKKAADKQRRKEKEEAQAGNQARKPEAQIAQSPAAVAHTAPKQLAPAAPKPSQAVAKASAPRPSQAASAPAVPKPSQAPKPSQVAPPALAPRPAPGPSQAARKPAQPARPQAPAPTTPSVTAPTSTPSTPAFTQHRNPFAPRPPVPASMATSPPFFPRAHPMSSQSQSRSESEGEQARDQTRSPSQPARALSRSPSARAVSQRSTSVRARDQSGSPAVQSREHSSSPFVRAVSQGSSAEEPPASHSSPEVTLPQSVAADSPPAVETPPYDASDFPPGFDISVLEGADASQSASSASRILRPRQQPTAAALDAVLRSNSTANAGSASRGRVTSKRSATNENISKSKEATVTDAAGLTEKQILSEKLYQPHQIKWLEEAGMLTTVYRGKFSSAEFDAISAAFDSWCTSQGISRAEGIELIHNRTPEQAQMYADLTTHLTASVEGRALRAVRRFVMENFHQAKTGPWSDDDIQALRNAHAEVGAKWSIIAQRLGRLARDVRVKYRDHVERRPSGDAANGTNAASSSNGKTSTSTPKELNTGPWSRKDTEKLEQTVRAQCTTLSLDVDGPNLPWKPISLTLNRSTHSCLLKWSEMRAKQKAGQDPYAHAAGEAAYNSGRHDYILVKRLLSRQKEILTRNDSKLIRWSRIIDSTSASDDNDDEDSLPFSKEIVSKAFARLVKRIHADEPSSADLPLLEMLETHALPLTQAAHKVWRKNPKGTSRGPKSGSNWSQVRLEAAASKREDRQAEKEARKAQKAQKREEKQRKKDEERQARNGTMAAEMRGKDGEVSAKTTSPRKRRRVTGGKVDLSDMIDSDEE